MRINLFAVDTHGLEGRDASWNAYLSPARLEKLTRITNPSAKAQSLGAELALLGAMKMAGIPQRTALHYYYDEHGAPDVARIWKISFTHTPGLSACALSKMEVGLDAEGPRRIPDALALRVLNAEEYQRYAQDANRELRFLQAWTTKEARFKCRFDAPQTRTICLPAGYVLSVAAPDVEDIRLEVSSHQLLRRIFPRFLYGGNDGAVL